ncbi:MAG: hypothetical protein AB8F78_01625 [Saprospiraceae bacterium]
MTDELKKYLLEQCRDWMLPEEIKALRRLTLTATGEELSQTIAQNSVVMEKLYGFDDEKTNELVTLGKEKLEIAVTERMLKASKDQVINNCPKCDNLAKTPLAKQCEHCGNDWH